MLMDERSGGLLQASENPLSLFTQELDQAAEDDSVKAIVLRVNSPGGSVTTSDTCTMPCCGSAPRRTSRSSPPPQELDASGAYYVSCAADKIIVNPTSIVGSIGVIFESFDFEDNARQAGGAQRRDQERSAEGHGFALPASDSRSARGHAGDG